MEKSHQPTLVDEFLTVAAKNWGKRGKTAETGIIVCIKVVRGGQRWTIQTAYEPAYDMEWEANALSLFFSLSLGVSSFMDFFIVVVVDCTAAASGIRIFNVGVPVWILN